MKDVRCPHKGCKSSMGILTEEKLAERLNSESNLVNILKLHNGGRPRGAENKSVELRALAGFLAHFEPAREVAKNLGLNPQMVHHYKHGNNGQDNPSEGLKDKLAERLGTAKDKALTKMLSCLDGITDEKLKEVKPVALSTVARNMAAIIEKTSERIPNSVAQFNIYAPRMKDEKEFEVIEVER